MRMIALWCAFAVVASLTILLDSFTPGAPHLPVPVLFVAFVGSFRQL
ncbi:hypothetical protein [Amycolatopsis sp. NPDC051372]